MAQNARYSLSSMWIRFSIVRNSEDTFFTESQSRRFFERPTFVFNFFRYFFSLVKYPSSPTVVDMELYYQSINATAVKWHHMRLKETVKWKRGQIDIFEKAKDILVLSTRFEMKLENSQSNWFLGLLPLIFNVLKYNRCYIGIFKYFL